MGTLREGHGRASVQCLGTAEPPCILPRSILPSLIYDIAVSSLCHHCVITVSYMTSLSQGIINTDPRFIAVPDHFVNLIPTVPTRLAALPVPASVVST